MLRKVLFGLSIPAMALGAVLMSSSTSFARPHGGGGGGHGGGGHGGGGWGGGGRGGYGGGWGGYGGYGGGWGRGWGGFGLGYGLGYLSGGGWGYPGWGGYDSYPGYAYNGYDYGYPAYSYSYPDYGYAQPGIVYQQPDISQYSSAYSPSVAGQQEPNTVLLNVQVPPNAQLWVDGTATNETGTMRQFESPPLQPGQQYTYTIRARWMQNGRPVDITRRVDVAANERRSVNFLAQASQNQNMAPNTFNNVPPAPNFNNRQFAPNANQAPNFNSQSQLAPNANQAPNFNNQPQAAPNANQAPTNVPPQSAPNAGSAPRHNPVP